MKKALLIIDIQLDFTGADARMPVDKAQAQRMIDTVNNLVERAKEQDWLIIYIGNEYAAFDPLNVFRHFAAIRHTAGIALDPRLSVVGDYYFPKHKNSAFSNPGLTQFLKSERVETVILTGLYAEACIWDTLKDAHRHGFRTEIEPEAIATKTEAKRRTMIKRYVQEGAALLSVWV